MQSDLPKVDPTCATPPEASAGAAPSTPIDPRSLKTFAEFYPFYLGEHSNVTCRRLHFIGSSLALLCLAMLAATGRPLYLLYGALCAYGFAWAGHFLFEKNRPATFTRPLYSFIGDWVMYKDMWAGRVGL